MIRHKIYIRRIAAMRLSIPLIKRCIRETLRLEGVDMPCEVSVLITDDAGIRGINREFREIDKPTDVLSFPAQELVPGEFAPGETDLNTGLMPLGDIILSAQRVDAQAQEYGQSRERETAYLVIHSVLHLLGYDHVDEAAEKRRMRKREEEILTEIGYKT
jgi:probable rRNA maturation factor